MSEAAIVEEPEVINKKTGWRGPEGSINRQGRPKEEDRKKVTRRSLRDKELMQLARKLRPHQSAAIMEAVRIMGNKEATDANKLKAVAFLSDTYRKLINEIYEGEPEEDDKGQVPVEDTPVEVQPQVDNRPLFSLRVLSTPEDTKC